MVALREFVERNKIDLRSFYNYKNLGFLPKGTKIGRQVFFSKEDCETIISFFEKKNLIRKENNDE